MPARRLSPAGRRNVRPSLRFLNRFSDGARKVENHAAMVSLHFMHHNFARAHSSLGKQTTPAMAAGVANHVWTIQEIAELLD